MTKWRRKTNNNIQNTAHKCKNRAHRNPLATGGELKCSGRISSSWSTSKTHHVSGATYPVTDERSGLWCGRTEDICGHSKWWLGCALSFLHFAVLFLMNNYKHVYRKLFKMHFTFKIVGNVARL